MKVDLVLAPSGDIRQDAARIQRAAELGFDAVWTRESAHNPFFPLTIAAKDTRDIGLGALNIAAFARSPMITAQIAWDLARQSDGCFLLGLDAGNSAFAAEAEREQEDPVGRLREVVESLRAIWNTFQTGARLRFRGQHYQFRLMAPFFNPGPIDHPAIPIYLAGDDPALYHLAGELGAGFCAAPFQTASRLRAVILPALEASLRAAARDRSELQVAAGVLVVSGVDDNARARSEQFARRLIARSNQEQLEPIALVSEPSDICARLIERYAGIADRVCIYADGLDDRALEAIARSR